MNDVELIHRHGGVAVDMQVVKTDRIDHLWIHHYRCECGVGRAVLERMIDAGEGNLIRWPFERADDERHREPRRA
jgi:hypothetical protein